MGGRAEEAARAGRGGSTRLGAGERARALALLERLLACPSVNGSAGELGKARLIAGLLEEAGLAPELRRQGARRGNVYCHLPGRAARRRLLLNGHLDTVPYGERAAWTSAPERPARRGGRLYARGACDMQAGLAGMLCALLFLRERGTDPCVSLSFAATCDEEAGGAGARACLDEPWLREAECILLGEPTDLRLGLCEKGCSWLRLDVRGKTGHGAYPERGCNAVEHGFALIARLREQVALYRDPLLGASSLQITQVEGGLAPNMTPDRAVFVLDCRNTPELDNARLEALLEREIAAQRAAGGDLLSVAVSALNRRPPLSCPPEHPWALALSGALERGLGARPERCGLNFFTDASLLVEANPEAAILICGPGDPALCHQVDEYVEEAQYLRYIEILLDFLTRGQEEEDGGRARTQGR